MALPVPRVILQCNRKPGDAGKYNGAGLFETWMGKGRLHFSCFCHLHIWCWSESNIGYSFQKNESLMIVFHYFTSKFKGCTAVLSNLSF